MKATLTLIGLFLIPVLGFSQTDASSGKTIEEKRLQSSVEVQVISSLVAEPSRPEKMRALDFLESMISSGKATAGDTDTVALLTELASEGTAKQVYQNRRLINDFPDVRRRAAELLGKLGGDEARDALLNIAQKDQEPMVIAQAVYSLGLITGGDDAQRNKVELVIARIVTVQDAVNPDNSLALAATVAIEALGKNASGKVNPEVFAALVRIENGNYVQLVRQRAKAVIDSYTKFN